MIVQRPFAPDYITKMFLKSLKSTKSCEEFGGLFDKSDKRPCPGRPGLKMLPFEHTKEIFQNCHFELMDCFILHKMPGPQSLEPGLKFLVRNIR